MRSSGFKRFIAAMSAAVIAAGVLASPVYAVFDPLTGEEFSGEYGVDYARDPVTKHLFNVPASDKAGMRLINGIMVKRDSTGVHPYTGRANVKENVRYYDTGIMWTGWRKIGGKWYYFDPDNDGFMATEKAETAAGTYYFDEDGAWNGKLSGKAKMPDNFAFSISETAYGRTFEINSGKKLLIISEWEESDGRRKINITKSDMQIFYDMAVSCGITDMKRNMKGSDLAERLNIQRENEVTDIANYYIVVRAGESSNIVNADYYTYKYCGKSEDADQLAKFLLFANRYAEGLPQYKELTAGA